MKKILCIFMTLMSMVGAIAQTPNYQGIIYVTPTGAGAHSGDSWANATSSIDTALSLAQANNAVVWVAAGNYYSRFGTFTLVDGVSLYGGFAGDEPADYDLSQRNFSMNASFLNGRYARRVITQDSNFVNPTVVDGFTIQNGRDYFVAGALIRGNTTLSHCIIKYNVVWGNNMNIPNNNDFYGAAGGLHCVDAIVIHCEIKQNGIDGNPSQGSLIAKKTCAGGITSVNSTISNCLITDNSAYSIGGLATTESQIVNCNIVRNNGINAYLYGNQSFVNCILWDNRDSYSDISFLNGTDVQNCFSNCAIGRNNPSSIFSNEKNIDLHNDNIGYSGFNGWRPHFTDPDSGCFTLSPMSILIDGGTIEGIDIPEYDLNGNPRVQQHGIDIGCYEFTNNGQYGYNGIVYVKPNAAGDSTGTSWTNAMPDLQAAVNTANAIGDGCQVWVSSGTYHGNKHGFSAFWDGKIVSIYDENNTNCFTMREGVNVYGGFAGNEPSSYDLSLRNFTTNKAILDGENLRRVLYQPTPFETQTIWDGFYIQNGYDSLCHYRHNSVQDYSQHDEISKLILPGAGCYLTGNTILSHCIIRNNKNAGDGGGVWAKNATLYDCEIYNNSVKALNNSYYISGGGGVFADSVSFINCSIHNNVAQAEGGGAYCQSYSSFTNCNISNNTANSFGGGVFCSECILIL